LGPLGFAAGTVIVLFFFAGFVHVFDFLRELEDAVFDGINGGVEVDVVVVFIDGALLAFTGFLARVTDNRSARVKHVELEEELTLLKVYLLSICRTACAGPFAAYPEAVPDLRWAD